LKKKNLFIFFIAVSLVTTSFSFSRGYCVSNPKCVCVAILLYDGGDFENLSSFLKDVGFRSYTFIIQSNAFYYYLGNASRLSVLQSNGELIPYFGYVQCWSNQTRCSIVNSTLHEWYRYVGSFPKGVMMFQPDTYALNFLFQDFRVEYCYGYCPDQYLIDYMTMRGGSQMPYYADSLNALMPNRFGSGGIVVLPWLLWDWVDGYTVNYSLCNHPLDNARRYADLYGYVAALTDRTLAGSSPFGYVSYSFEWGWCASQNATHDAKTILENMLSHSDYSFLRVGDFVDWFKLNYPVMPSYDVNFISPNSGEKVEWLINRDCRVVRVGEDEVYSYVDYTNQVNDRFLNEAESINFSLPWSANNSIDDSLSFKVDYLGGGELRAPPVGHPVKFEGTLVNFPKFYSARDSGQPTASSETQPWGLLELVYPIAVAIVVVVIVAVALVLRKRSQRASPHMALMC
jgi:hypothetical protein